MKRLALLPIFVTIISCGSTPAQPLPCNNEQLHSGCVVGHCTLSSSSDPLPSGSVIDLTETPIPDELTNDSVSSTLCNVSLPSGAVAGDITLAIASAPVPADGVIYQWQSPLASSVTSSVEQSSINTLLAGSGSFGVTHTPAQSAIDASLGVDPPESGDLPHILRNFEGYPFTAAFFDGKHLLLGNGPRILIFDGIPTLNQTPSVVLGQANFDATITATTSASAFGSAGVSGIWSDGTRVVASNTNRVLVWLSFPTSDYAPADLVLGQNDFASNKENGGGAVSASTLVGATAVDSDGTNLIVSDTYNSRILKWSSFPSSVGQPADLVVGQPNFTSNATDNGATDLYLPFGAKLNGSQMYVSGYGGPGLRVVDSIAGNNPPSSAFVFCWPWGADYASTCAEATRPAGIRLTPNGGVALRDQDMERVLVTNAAPTGPTEPSFVLGQPDALRMVTVVNGDGLGVNPTRVSGSSFGNGYDLGSSSQQLALIDDRRVLIWSQFPSYNNQPADVVVGQPGFASNELTDYRTISASTLMHPADVAIAGATAAIADTGNNRVLLYTVASLYQQLPQATTVLGQVDTQSFVANHDLTTVDAKGLSGPTGICLDGAHVIVADTENHRVLIWNNASPATSAGADIVLGQADFTGHSPNHGRVDVSPKDGFSDVGSDGFFYPTGVACDGVHLAVADRGNSRVLVWTQFPQTNGQPADVVIGQPTFTTVGANAGNGPFTIAPNGLNLPMGVLFAGSSLWIADTENNRLVRWDNVFASPAPAAWLGQPDGATITNPTYQLGSGPFQGYAAPAPTTSMTSVLRPRALVIAANTLYVAETDSNRIHAFDATSLSPTAVIGQPLDTTASLNANGVSSSSLGDPLGLAANGSDLFVADARNSRVLDYALQGLSSGASAAFVVGQSSFSASGVNASTTAAQGTVAQPNGLRMTSTGELFVTDPTNNRVLVFDASGDSPNLTTQIGQSNSSGNSPNAGGDVGPAGLAGPRGVWADANHVVIADTTNNRALVYDRSVSMQSAQLVLGQTSMTTSAANAGGVSLSSLQAPSDACSDGTRLAIVDSGNSRVLVWNAMPTQNGVAADVVLGQTNVTGALANGGTGNASAASLSLPNACIFVGASLYVADTGNNRVARYDDFTSGALATAVLGQIDASSRIPGAVVTDLVHFAGPAGLAFDGTNLYVADRDLGRVIVLRDPTNGGSQRDVITATDLGYRPTSGLAVADTPFFTSRLYVSDASTSRVFRISSLSRLSLTSSQ